MDILDRKIVDLPLSIRAKRCLTEQTSIGRYGSKRKRFIITVRDLTNTTYRDLTKIRNLGWQTYREIEAWLEKNGLSLKRERQRCSYCGQVNDQWEQIQELEKTINDMKEFEESGRR